MRFAGSLLSVFLIISASAQNVTISRAGTQESRQGPVENFTGSVRVDPLFNATDATRATGALVTFDAGAHSAWHTHPLGLLIVTAMNRPEQLRSHLVRQIGGQR